MIIIIEMMSYSADSSLPVSAIIIYLSITIITITTILIPSEGQLQTHLIIEYTYTKYLEYYFGIVFFF